MLTHTVFGRGEFLAYGQEFHGPLIALGVSLLLALAGRFLKAGFIAAASGGLGVVAGWYTLSTLPFSLAPRLLSDRLTVLAAAGLIALEKGPARLYEDHANARLLAEALAHIDDVVIDLDSVETNIVVFRVTGGVSAKGVVARLKERGILISAFGADAIRLVTHLDVDREACVTAAGVLAEEIAAMK